MDSACRVWHKDPSLVPAVQKLFREESQWARLRAHSLEARLTDRSNRAQHRSAAEAHSWGWRHRSAPTGEQMCSERMYHSVHYMCSSSDCHNCHTRRHSEVRSSPHFGPPARSSEPRSADSRTTESQYSTGFSTGFGHAVPSLARRPGFPRRSACYKKPRFSRQNPQDRGERSPILASSRKGVDFNINQVQSGQERFPFGFKQGKIDKFWETIPLQKPSASEIEQCRPLLQVLPPSISHA